MLDLEADSTPGWQNGVERNKKYICLKMISPSCVDSAHGLMVTEPIRRRREPSAGEPVQTCGSRGARVNPSCLSVSEGSHPGRVRATHSQGVRKGEEPPTTVVASLDVFDDTGSRSSQNWESNRQPPTQYGWFSSEPPPGEHKSSKKSKICFLS